MGNSKSPAKLGKRWQRDFARCPNIELISGLVRAAFCGWPGCGVGVGGGQGDSGPPLLAKEGQGHHACDKRASDTPVAIALVD